MSNPELTVHQRLYLAMEPLLKLPCRYCGDPDHCEFNCDNLVWDICYPDWMARTYARRRNTALARIISLIRNRQGEP